MRYFLLSILIVAFCSCGKNESVNTVSGTALSGESFICDAEKIKDVDGEAVFETSSENIFANNASFQTGEVSKSGKYAVKLTEENQYGFGVNLTNLKAGNFLRATVWQKQGIPNGTLIASMSGEDVVFSSRTYYDKCKVKEGDWVKHSLSVIVTPGISEASLYVFSGGKTTYFDDLEVELFETVPQNEYKDQVNINLQSKASKKILGFINEAAQGQVILDKHKKYLKGAFQSDSNTYKMKLKLKGDWTDHLTSGKISCRIKMKGEGIYKHKKTFSFHHPSTRNYIDEWLVHKIAEQEDVLTTTYDFTNVKVNGVNFGLYAMEEHFEKQLLESRNRREGPILKFDETGMWNLIYEQSKKETAYNLPYYEASVISVFKKGKTFKSPALLNGFLEGSKLLQLYKDGYLNIEEIFDLNQMAKFHVILDITSGNHAVEWHNRRFYYNPVSQKLEHILYDVMPFDVEGSKEFLHQRQFEGFRRTPTGSLDFPFILSEEYQQLYLTHLERMTAPAYWDSLYATYKDEILEIESAIQVEVPDYHFEGGKYVEIASYLRDNKQDLIVEWDEIQAKYSSTEEWIVPDDFKNVPDSLVISGISLNAYLEEDSAVIGYPVRLENYHYTAIEICGYERENWPGQVFELNEKIQLSAFNTAASSGELLLDFKPTRLFFIAKNRGDRYFETKVIQYPKPEGVTSRMNLGAQENWKKYCNFNGNRAVLKSGEISELICFPKNISVVMPQGCQLDLVKGGGIVVQKSLDVNGTQNAPVIINSSDSSSVGITVLEADYVKINHLHANGLSNLSYKAWQLTGAISIYESPTTINGLKIDNAPCEDALNIIRSEFNIQNLEISNCASDAFDADFCTGKLSGAVFRNSGNDCIDFSGSMVDIENVEVYNCGDKGVSGGEGSTLSLFNIYIEGAVTGIASKDQSEINAEQIAIKNAEYNLMVFQKKPEYGGAFIILKNVNFTVDYKSCVIDLGSYINLENEVFRGQEKIDVDKLYERF